MSKTSKYENYRTYKGIECLNSCIYNYIFNKGFNITRSDIFFLGQGLDITYTGHPDEKMIYSRQYESNYLFIKKFMPETICENIVDKDINSMSEFLREKVLSDESIIVQVSSTRLPYNKVFPVNEIISHFINVLKYDDVNRKYYISDGCPPVMTDEVWEDWISEEELLDNWSSMGGKYIVLKFDNNNLDSVKSKSLQEFQSQLKSYVKGRNILIKSKYKGYKSAVTLLKDMLPLFENNVPETKQLVINVNRQFKINGFLQAKEYILDKTRDINEDICIQYKDIIDEWNKQMLLFIKIGISSDTNRYSKLIKDIECLTDKELEILENIYGEIRNKV